MTTNGSPSVRYVRISGWSTLYVRLPQFHVGILAEMLDISFDQRGQLPRLANLDPVVDRPEKAVALRLKGATCGIDKLEDQHRRVMDGFPQVGHQLDVCGRVRVQLLEQISEGINLLHGRID